ncbi:MAG: hypothetical protein ABFD46_08820 [Armatimonadota bacterium]
MRELHGTPRIQGVAIAMATVVDIQSGLSGVPENIMRQGLKSLKMGLKPDDYPEAIIICDLLSIGSAVRIPGIRTAGIVSETDDQPGLPIAVPCVSGVGGLLQSLDCEQLVIIDGDEGVVYIDPNAETVIRYQNNQASQQMSRVFLESAHLPARTQNGRVVLVSAVVSSIQDAEIAISQGADSLVVLFSRMVDEETRSHHSELSDPDVELFETLLALSAGKPMKVHLDNPDIRIVRLSEQFATAEHIEFSEEDEQAILSEKEVVDAVDNSGAEYVVVAASDVAKTKDMIRTLSGNTQK